jgi:hypothetical protein
MTTEHPVDYLASPLATTVSSPKMMKYVPWWAASGGRDT